MLDNPSITPETQFKETLASCKQVFAYGALFGCMSNLLMLALPLYSLQVLDRVLSSGSMETLMMLTIITLLSIGGMEAINAIRSFMLIRMGEWLEEKVAPLLFHYSLMMSAQTKSANGSQQLRDFATLKQFLTGPQLNTLVDSPWALIFIIVLFLIHPMLGWLTIIGGVVLLVFAFLNEKKTKPLLEKSNKYSVAGLQMSDAMSRNAEVIEGMGMHHAVTGNWYALNKQTRKWQVKASHFSTLLGNSSKFIRLALQIAVTGLGGYLVLQGELTSGAMIASSILAGRALAPFESSIMSWKSVVAARTSYTRLAKVLQNTVDRFEAMELPVPQGNLQVENLSYVLSGSTKPILKSINFEIDAGEGLGVIGPSASGKSSLAKLLLGVWKASAGNVRLDGADVYQWKRDDFGKYVGYLPQDVELFAGTVKDNIARMDKEADPAKIVEAAKLAKIHEMILRLPLGYDTDIGSQGASLSAGQRQRVGLARAFYGNPKLVVLDEPNSNLDQEGDLALAAAIRDAKANGMTVVIISHRPAIMAEVDKMLVLQEGQVASFGTRNEVMGRFSKAKVSALTAPKQEEKHG